MAYTLRLNKKQDTKLKKVMTLLNDSTASKAIINLINNYEADQKTITKLNNQLSTTETELENFKSLLHQKALIDKQISKCLSK